MDPRLQEILSQQQASRFSGLAGTEAEATIRIADRLLNELIATFLPRAGALRSAIVASHTGNRIDVSLALAKPAFLPPIPLTLAIEQQPEIPADPVLGLRVAGGAGMLMRFAGPVLGPAANLPPFVRMDGERLRVDVRRALQQMGQASALDHVQLLRVNTEAGGLAVHVVVRVP